MVAGSLRQFGAKLALVSLMPVCLGGCVSISTHTKVAPPPDAPGRLVVQIYENRADRDEGRLTQRRVVSELRDSKGDLVWKMTAASWVADDLPPGANKLRIANWIDPRAGDRLHRFSSSDTKKVVLASGQATTAVVLVKDSRELGLFVGLYLVVALAGIFLAATSIHM